MIFRMGDRRPASQERLNEVLEATERVFLRHPDAVDGDLVTLDDLAFVYDPLGQPSFVLRPECDRCAATDPTQFPLEEWTLLGATVRAQARSTCRDCRFVLATTSDGGGDSWSRWSGVRP